jgi:excisionase family DNA binding protein
MTLSNDTYFTTEQAAEHTGLSKSYFEKLRVRGDGPAYYKVSARRVLYKRAELEAWMATHRRHATSEAPQGVAGGAL